MRQFPASPITALIDESPEVNLSESIGPNLSVADILGPGGVASLAGLSLGQQVNVSRNGYSYSFVQPELSFTRGNVLVSARASFMPYNATLPDVEEITRRDDRPVVERNEYRVSEFSLSFGVRL